MNDKYRIIFILILFLVINFYICSMNLLSRNILPLILDNLSFKEFIIITGPRQCGKTSLLRLIEGNLQLMGEPIFYLTLEDPAQ
jgi:predicted AAA+ superfamily ATPase